MKHILALLLFPFAVFSQNEIHITSNDSDCGTLANFEMYPENNLSVSQNTSIRFIDYKPILVGNDKSILKIQVESDNLPDSLKIILLNATLLDNGLGYDLIAGDSIYTSTDSIQTHIFKDDIMKNAAVQARMVDLYRNPPDTCIDCSMIQSMLMGYALTQAQYETIEHFPLKKVNKSIYYNQYVINLVTDEINQGFGLETAFKTLPNVFSNWNLSYESTLINGYYLEYLFPQAFNISKGGKYNSNGRSYGATTMNANMNSSLWNHELTHMVVNPWSVGFFGENNNSAGHWIGLERENSGFGTQCYNGVHDSVYYENGEVVFDYDPTISRGGLNDIEKVLWGIQPIDSISFPIKLTKNYNNYLCSADSILFIHKEEMQDILTEYEEGRLENFDEGVIPTIFLVVTNMAIGVDGMNILADAIKRRENYLKESFFCSSLELDYDFWGEANNYYSDEDLDGFFSDIDCDDSNPNINPDAEEIPGNGIDENCDGKDATTGIYELVNSTIRIYPNPVSDILNIEINGQLDFKISLFDFSGKQVISFMNERTIDVSSIPNGIYLLELEDQGTGQNVLERIVIGR